MQDGWLQYGPHLTVKELELSGGPLTATSAVRRGVWGVPNEGISKPDPRPGYYNWGLPLQNEPGEYSLCWCAAREDCSTPENFKVLISPIVFRGPQVLPSSAQTVICVRNRQCQAMNFTGVWPSAGGQLFIADGLCGQSKAALGAPRDGVSETSPQGNDFSWGSEPIITPPGKYRLCWCLIGYACTQPEEFVSFAGILRVKAPFGPRREFFCAIGRKCTVSDIIGEGGGPTDQVAVMTVCGNGDPTDAFEKGGVSKTASADGTSFGLPKAIKGGTFQLCWCAGESLCASGLDFDHTLGTLIVGGPDPSPLYVCYEWEPCTIESLKGTVLRNGDRLLVLHGTYNCSNETKTNSSFGGHLSQWPQGGLGEPATRSGTVHTWGSGKVRVAPGIYTLCWCSIINSGNCTEHSLYDTPAGQVRVGTSKEFQYLSGVTDPEPRNMEALYGLLLVGPLALAACSLGFFGYKRITARNNKREAIAAHPFPTKKAWAQSEQDRLRLMHSVKQVKAQRELALDTLDGMEEDGRMQALDLPNFSGKKQSERKSLFMVPALDDFTEQVTPQNALALAGSGTQLSLAKSVAFDTASQPQAALQKSATQSSGFMSRFGRGMSRGATQETIVEVRRIQERGRVGQDAWRQGPERGATAASLSELDNRNGLGPESPVNEMFKDWDLERDGPMPPDVTFPHSVSERRRNFLLKVLEM